MFPLFFFLVAALVCVTTMTRMVDEQRTQNGVLKALGYGSGAIVGQYLFYAGSASALGCIAGFLLGSRFLPMALWRVYRIMYAIDRPVDRSRERDRRRAAGGSVSAQGSSPRPTRKAS